MRYLISKNIESFSKIDLNRFLRRNCGLNINQAKDKVDELLDNNSIEIISNQPLTEKLDGLTIEELTK